MGGELWCEKAQKRVNLDFQVKFHLDGPDQSVHKTTETPILRNKKSVLCYPHVTAVRYQMQSGTIRTLSHDNNWLTIMTNGGNLSDFKLTGQAQLVSGLAMGCVKCTWWKYHCVRMIFDWWKNRLRSTWHPFLAQEKTVACHDQMSCINVLIYSIIKQEFWVATWFGNSTMCPVSFKYLAIPHRVFSANQWFIDLITGVTQWTLPK